MYSVVAKEFPKNGMTIGYSMRRDLTLLQAEIYREVYITEGPTAGDKYKLKKEGTVMFSMPLSALTNIKEYVIEADTKITNISNCVGNVRFIYGVEGNHIAYLKQFLADWEDFWEDL